ncbi:uncharacterized protein I206_101504 [Kwoniella pini CBS 10737]|uniref:Uncharacterized protein n=1 Tax=Kwoniella pini CBS 10737 TaxID=1296096 RepID=A0A1B9HWJ0_9TREE|nr:uncharacterized protein I206_06523 [Kwoniella pini CBS 10737]OCF47620.1 hypothetical protein I206_06523 [Kwoniella pini CBS 10737]
MSSFHGGNSAGGSSGSSPVNGRTWPSRDGRPLDVQYVSNGSIVDRATTAPRERDQSYRERFPGSGHVLGKSDTGDTANALWGSSEGLSANADPEEPPEQEKAGTEAGRSAQGSSASGRSNF